MADADLVWEKNTAGWLVDKTAEQSYKYKQNWLLVSVARVCRMILLAVLEIEIMHIYMHASKSNVRASELNVVGDVGD